MSAPVIVAAKAADTARDAVSKLPWKWIGLAGLAVGSLYLGDRLIKNQQARDHDRRLTTHENSPQEIARLIHKEGATELWEWPSQLYVDEDRLLQLATQIYDFNAVRQAYESIYRGRNLLTDLENWLSAIDYQNFINIAQKVK